jgi:NAD(P)-dependent dehydrogenase (short-subunit alcohol dehydrogenase family)
MAIPNLTRTDDDFGTQFGVNHLAQFLLFQLLESYMISSSSLSFNSQVIAVSSSGYRGGGLRLDDYNSNKRPQGYEG